MAEDVARANTLNVPNAKGNPFIDALEQIRPEFETLAKEALPPITLNPVATAVTLRSVLPRLMALRSELAALPKFDIRNLDRLELYLHAWMRAQALHVGSSLPAESFSALSSRLAHLRELYLADARALIGRDQLHPDALTGLKGGTSHKNIASDLLTLTTVFRSNWHRISGRTCVTLTELDETDAAVDQLLTELGVRERTHATKEETALQRKQAYTLFVRAYDQVRRAVLFDRWDEGDAGEIAPALFGGHRRKTKADVAPNTAEPQPSVALAAPNPKADTDALQAHGEDPFAPGVGMPGADPFTDES